MLRHPKNHDHRPRDEYSRQTGDLERRIRTIRAVLGSVTRADPDSPQAREMWERVDRLEQDLQSILDMALLIGREDQ